MLKTYRNDYDFTLIIGSYVVRPGDTIELVGYNGSMLTPVQAEEPVAEPEAEEKPKRAKKAAAEPEAE
jgi:hypothetical protein|nr:MAG TPA: hypothetical protein [Caudoviricetes sp.]